MRIVQMWFQPMTDKYHAQKIETDHKLVLYKLRTHECTISIANNRIKCSVLNVAFFIKYFGFYPFFRVARGCKTACWEMCVLYATELSDCQNNSKPVKYHAFRFIYGSMMLSSLLSVVNWMLANDIFPHISQRNQQSNGHRSLFMLFWVVQHFRIDFMAKAYLEHVPTKITDLFLRYFPCARCTAPKFHIGLLLFDFRPRYIYPGFRWILFGFLTFAGQSIFPLSTTRNSFDC